jgi:hypothetical protein
MLITYEKNGAVVEIEFDAVLRLTPNTSSTATSHPVQKGAPISDHVRPEPLRLSVEAMVTNTPIKVPRTQMNGVTGTVTSQGMDVRISTVVGPGVRQPSSVTVPVTALRFSDKFDRVRDVYRELRAIQDASQPVSIRTMKGSDDSGNEVEAHGLEDYEDMVIVSLSAPRDAQSGSAVAFTFDAQKVRIVDTTTIQTAAVNAPAKTTARRGQTGKKEITEKEPKKRDLLGQALERGRAYLR